LNAQRPITKKRGDPEGAAGELEPVAPAAVTAGPAATAAHQDAKLFLALADNLVDLRDLLFPAGPPGTTGSTRSAAGAIVAPVAAARAATAPGSATIASHVSSFLSHFDRSCMSIWGVIARLHPRRPG
jgi:hypothetical protein